MKYSEVLIDEFLIDIRSMLETVNWRLSSFEKGEFAIENDWQKGHLAGLLSANLTIREELEEALKNLEEGAKKDEMSFL
jgi:hypothetical protein